MQFRIERYFKEFSSGFLDFNSSQQNYIEYSNDMIPWKKLFATIPSSCLGTDMKIKEKAHLLPLSCQSHLYLGRVALSAPYLFIYLQCPQLA